MCGFSISVRSASHRDSGHCFGYHAAPRYSGTLGFGTASACDEMAEAANDIVEMPRVNVAKQTMLRIRFMNVLYWRNALKILLSPDYSETRVLACRSTSAADSGVISRCGPPSSSNPTINFRMLADRSNGG